MTAFVWETTKTLITQTISVVFPVALNSRWAGSKQTCFRLRIKNRAHKTYIFANGTSWVMLGWGGGDGGVWWGCGGGVNVLSSAYSKCCHAAEISGMLATLVRCGDLWNAFYVTCCYAAEISGMLATLLR